MHHNIVSDALTHTPNADRPGRIKSHLQNFAAQTVDLATLHDSNRLSGYALLLASAGERKPAIDRTASGRLGVMSPSLQKMEWLHVRVSSTVMRRKLIRLA